MLVLAIETSCDETSAAVVKDKIWVLSNVVLSQMKLHEPYGGIVPEIASRKQLEFLGPVVQKALNDSNASWKDLQAIAVTNQPGLIGSLLVGVNFAKAIAICHDLPLIPINHLEGHIFSVFLMDKKTNFGGNFETLEFPFLCLLVSGGHTQLIWVEGVGNYKLLGQTRDDAAGEAFDKVARALGLGFPGGEAIDNLSGEGDLNAIAFPRADLSPTLDFSFAGLKTAVVRYLKGMEEKLKRKPNPTKADIAASFQEAVVDMLLSNLKKAAELTGSEKVAIVGGVAANKRLRTKLDQLAKRYGWQVVIPPPLWCLDNAAMIGCAASFRLNAGLAKSDLDCDAYAITQTGLF